MKISPTYLRRSTSTTQIGELKVGSDYPIRIQTMANTSTNDIEASVAQAMSCARAGAEIFRFTTQGMNQVEAVKEIRERLRQNLETKGGRIPIVADVHFRSDVADAAAQVVDKVRINPGNYANDATQIEDRFLHLIDICKTHHTAIRIGVNHGSLSRRIMEQYGDTPEGMVASCMEFLRIAVKANFQDIVLSIKASNTRVMVDTVRLLVRTMDAANMHYPLHLGVTEAGEGEDGRIKSAVGIGALLAEGIGDTIRVSLSEAPEKEIPVAKALVDYFVQPHSPRYTGNCIEIENGILYYKGLETDSDLFALHAAAECGRLLWEHPGLQLQLSAPYISVPDDLAANILQAAGIKRYKTEFVSCPGCGRTMFDLQKVVVQLKQAFAQQELANGEYPKIAVMGCIVNGPGEMADADYGYVGAGRDRISLYKGKECILKNIEQDKAIQELIKLIQND